MPTLPDKVHPGDIISSELINAILTQLAALGSQPGAQTVPSLLGVRLIDARAMIVDPARQLSLGFVIDAAGAAVDPFASANADAVVLSQSPAAGVPAPPGSAVNLVVTASTSSGPAPTPAPTITGTETLSGAATVSFPVGATVVLVGTHFNATASQNTVTFNNRPAAAVAVDPADPTRRLLVTVPGDIPNAPTSAGDPSLTNVTVRVKTPSPEAVTTTITVTAPIPEQPTIGTVSPSSQFEGSQITIGGTNFATSAIVLIRDVEATVSSRTPTQIVAVVPQFPDISSGALVPASVTVSVPGVGDATFAGTFRVRGS